MNIDSNLAFSRKPEQIEDLFARRFWNISNAEPNPQRAIIQTLPDAAVDLLAFFRSGCPAYGGIPRQQRPGIMHDSHARGNVSRARAEIDQ